MLGGLPGLSRAAPAVAPRIHVAAVLPVCDAVHAVARTPRGHPPFWPWCCGAGRQARQPAHVHGLCRALEHAVQVQHAPGPIQPRLCARRRAQPERPAQPQLFRRMGQRRGRLAAGTQQAPRDPDQRPRPSPATARLVLDRPAADVPHGAWCSRLAVQWCVQSTPADVSRCVNTAATHTCVCVCTATHTELAALMRVRPASCRHCQHHGPR